MCRDIASVEINSLGHGRRKRTVARSTPLNSAHSEVRPVAQEMTLDSCNNKNNDKKKIERRKNNIYFLFYQNINNASNFL